MIGVNNSVTTYRLADSGNVTEYDASATLENVDVYIESAGAELAALIDQQPSLELYLMHMEPADIRVGDKVIDAQSNEYRVQAIERFENNLDTENLLIVRIAKEVERYSD